MLVKLQNNRSDLIEYKARRNEQQNLSRCIAHAQKQQTEREKTVSHTNITVSNQNKRVLFINKNASLSEYRFVF